MQFLQLGLIVLLGNRAPEPLAAGGQRTGKGSCFEISAVCELCKCQVSELWISCAEYIGKTKWRDI